MWVKRKVPRTGIEPARPIDHYPLKVARLPVPPPGPINTPLVWIPTRFVGTANIAKFCIMRMPWQDSFEMEPFAGENEL